jgi:hypothetical protein
MPAPRGILADGKRAGPDAPKALGARGIVRPSDDAPQVVLGPIADQAAGNEYPDNPAKKILSRLLKLSFFSSTSACGHTQELIRCGPRLRTH